MSTLSCLSPSEITSSITCSVERFKAISLSGEWSPLTVTSTRDSGIRLETLRLHGCRKDVRLDRSVDAFGRKCSLPFVRGRITVEEDYRYLIAYLLDVNHVSEWNSSCVRMNSVLPFPEQSGVQFDVCSSLERFPLDEEFRLRYLRTWSVSEKWNTLHTTPTAHIVCWSDSNLLSRIPIQQDADDVTTNADVIWFGIVASQSRSRGNGFSNVCVFIQLQPHADISHAKLEDSLSAKVDSLLWGILCICGHHYDPFPVSENISEDSFSLIETKIHTEIESSSKDNMGEINSSTSNSSGHPFFATEEFQRMLSFVFEDLSRQSNVHGKITREQFVTWNVEQGKGTSEEWAPIFDQYCSDSDIEWTFLEFSAWFRDSLLDSYHQSDSTSS